MDSLIENLLKVEATDHRKIQEEIQENLRSLGYYAELEKRIWAKVEKEKKPIVGQFYFWVTAISFYRFIFLEFGIFSRRFL